ncbi:MAG: hypothetical protein K8H88_18745 [Sandaracinaceae bacterium]|nr:hypothetical protein [Sandaracinaceae bacterium]
MKAGPEAARLSPTARHVLEALSSQTALAWPILKAQCELAGYDPALLASTELAEILPQLVTALARFTSPLKARAFERQVTSGPPSASGSRAGAAAGQGELTDRVLEVLGAYTPLASSVLETQCARAGIDPRDLDARALGRIVSSLADAVARFGSAESAESARAELAALLRE